MQPVVKGGLVILGEDPAEIASQKDLAALAAPFRQPFLRRDEVHIRTKI